MTHPYIAMLTIRERHSEKLARADERRLARAAREARRAKAVRRKAWRLTVVRLKLVRLRVVRR